MTIEGTPGAAPGGQTTTTTTPPGTAPGAAPAPAGAPPPNDPNGKPAWLDDRLAQAKKSERAALLKELGVEDEDSAKKAIADARAKAEAEKTAATKAAELEGKYKAEAAKTSAYEATVKEHSARMMVGLTPEQTAAVKALAGDDPLKQLQTITALAPTWAAKADPANGAGTPPVPPPTGAVPLGTAPPSNTAPPPNAPNGTAPGSAPNARAVYEDTRRTNPFAAASFAQTNDAAYTAKR